MNPLPHLALLQLLGLASLQLGADTVEEALCRKIGAAWGIKRRGVGMALMSAVCVEPRWMCGRGGETEGGMRREAG